MIRKPSSILGLVALVWFGASWLWAQPPSSGERSESAPVLKPRTVAAPASKASADTASEPKIVDFTADLMRPVSVGDSSALSLVGHVVFHHNGAVITCDSAIRYNDRQMDCFENVIINQDTTFIYGDRVEYNGFENLARVYAPLIKVVDGDAVFYTYQFSFNTLDNIGHYTGGGTVLQGENRLESEEGFYYVDDRLLLCVKNVEMENPDYRMRSDSVAYDMNTEIASFYTRSYIWNKENEFLTAVQGTYDHAQEVYTFTDSSYVMTETQEIWADTLIYAQPSGDALLLSHVQVVDDEQQAMAFGDYIRYWGQERKAVLTRDPVVATYEQQGDTIDTLFMRADSMFLYTINRFDSLASDSLEGDAVPLDSISARLVAREDSVEMPDSLSVPMAQPSDDTSVLQTPDSLSDATDAVGKAPDEQVGADEPPMTPKEKRAAAKRQKKEAARQAREEARRLKREKRRAALLQLQREAALIDSLARIDSLAQIDSLNAAQLDSLPQTQTADSLEAVSTTDSTSLSQDSLLRQMFAYRNVRVYRRDFQAVCDSLTGFTLDSTLHMYINPVMWNENNQITATSVDIYTRNQTIQKVVYVGDPIMSSEVDGIHYNQIKGKRIEAYFRDGGIFRTDVNGNGQTYYYMEDKDSLGRYISGLMTVECADISFYFEDKQLEDIVWRKNLSTMIYPMELIPEDFSQTLPGFRWEGDRRPTFEQVFDRTFRPSQRAYFRTISQPTYPITHKIDQYREQLIQQGTWRDRNDPLSQEAIDFLETLSGSI